MNSKIDVVSLAAKMKGYEKEKKTKLTPKVPTIIRIDGRAFSTYTKHFDKPFDDTITGAMKYTTLRLCEEVQNVKIGYSQSDEITLVMIEGKEDTQQWFGGSIQKIVSIAASIATYHFNEYMEKMHWQKRMLDPDFHKKMPAMFDARVFQVPKDELVESFVWRQEDGKRNSVSMLAQSMFSHEELKKKKKGDMLDMIRMKDAEWHDLPADKKFGFCAVKEFYVYEPEKDNNTSTIRNAGPIRKSRWMIDDDIPVFLNNSEYLERILFVRDIDDFND